MNRANARNYDAFCQGLLPTGRYSTTESIDGRTWPEHIMEVALGLGQLSEPSMATNFSTLSRVQVSGRVAIKGSMSHPYQHKVRGRDRRSV